MTLFLFYPWFIKYSVRTVSQQHFYHGPSVSPYSSVKDPKLPQSNVQWWVLSYIYNVGEENNSFSTAAHQAWSTENSISHWNRSKGKRIKLEPEPSLNCKWLRWSSQPISCIKSKAWSLACNSSVAPRKPSAVSAASIMLSRVRISEQTSFSATIKGKKLLQRPWSST